jgi:hypothetical protein
MTPEEIRKITPLITRNRETGDMSTVDPEREKILFLQEIAAQMSEQNAILYDLFNELQSWRRQG